MAREHAHRLYADGINLETIRLWLIPCTTRNERNDILVALLATKAILVAA